MMTKIDDNEPSGLRVLKDKAENPAGQVNGELQGRKVKLSDDPDSSSFSVFAQMEFDDEDVVQKEDDAGWETEEEASVGKGPSYEDPIGQMFAKASKES